MGRSATAQTDAKMTADILSWSRSRGVFAGIALKGATLREEKETNEKLYNRAVQNREIVTQGVAAPAAAQRPLTLLTRHSAHEKS